MDTQKMESPFRFMASRILELHIDNTYVELHNSPDNYKSIDVSHNISEILEQDNGWLGAVELSISVNITDSLEEKDDTSAKKYILNMRIEGGFSSGRNMSKEEFEQMLHINGSAALYSIARGFIISTTSQTLVGGQVVLPLLNFTK